MWVRIKFSVEDDVRVGLTLDLEFCRIDIFVLIVSFIIYVFAF